MGEGIAAECCDGEEYGEAGGVAEQDDAQGRGDGSSGVAGGHATGEVTSAPEESCGQGEERTCRQKAGEQDYWRFSNSRATPLQTGKRGYCCAGRVFGRTASAVGK